MSIVQELSKLVNDYNGSATPRKSASLMAQIGQTFKSERPDNSNNPQLSNHEKINKK